jgi:hypothetical protein
MVSVLKISHVVMALWLALVVSFFAYIRPTLAQTQDTINERFRSAIENNTREIDNIRRQEIDARLRILEEGLTEARWLGRSVAGVLIGQLVLGMLANRRKT